MKKMKWHSSLTVITIALATAGLITAAPPPGGGKGTCNADIPVQWEILDRYVDGVTNNSIQDDRIHPTDPPRPYINGQEDVQAKINVCNGTGSGELL
jgi:hypothetical protein